MNTENAKLRRVEDDLNVSGMGAVILGAWGILRAVIEILTETAEFFDFGEVSPVEKKIYTALMLSFILGFLVLVSWVHMHVGLNAMREARGKPYKKRYLIPAVIYIIALIASLSLYGEDFQDEDKLDTTIASILVDLTTIYLFIIVVRSALKIRKIRRDMPKEDRLRQSPEEEHRLEEDRLRQSPEEEHRLING
ncbi:MAG: hypothetical protein K6F35_09725 [Lachnospiraceae bacterium]|nr:hypothetical protein [Lachnospiraceae bacterium]